MCREWFVTNVKCIFVYTVIVAPPDVKAWVSMQHAHVVGGNGKISSEKSSGSELSSPDVKVYSLPYGLS